MQEESVRSHQRVVMDTLRVAWPNEARRYERIKINGIDAHTMADILKRLGARNCSVEEVKQLYFTTQSSVAPHRPKRKQTVEFKGNSHPERKGKHSGGRRFPAHVKQKYRDADMWYTSDDKRRFETDLISLQIVTSYKDGVENTRKKAIVPQRKFNYSSGLADSSGIDGNGDESLGAHGLCELALACRLLVHVRKIR